MEYLVLFIIIIALILIFIFRNKKKKLDTRSKKEIIRFFNNIKKSNSEKEKIIDFDKLYHKILRDLGYKGSFGEILKKEPREILNLNKIWELHKLRNSLVHQFDGEKQGFLEKKVKEYIKEINIIIKNI